MGEVSKVVIIGTGHVGRRPRCLVVHPVNPPHLAPVVGWAPADETEIETIIAIRRPMVSACRKPQAREMAP